MNDLLVALRAFKHGLISSVIVLLIVMALSILMMLSSGFSLFLYGSCSKIVVEEIRRAF